MLNDIENITKNFVNRDQELDKLKKTQTLLKKHKPKHLAIAGARRIGKSQLLYKYVHITISKDIVPIYIDVLYKRNWADFCDEIIRSLIKNYMFCTGKKLGVERFNTWFTGRLKDIIERLHTIEAELGSATGTYLKLRASIKERPEDEIELVKTTLQSLEEFAQKKNIIIVMILDEFQHIEKFNDTAETIAAMRSVIQFQKRVQYIFSGSSTTFINKIFTKSTAPFWRQVEICLLPPFTTDATMKLAKSMNINITKDESLFLNTLTKAIPDYLVKTLDALSSIKKPSKENMQKSFQEIVQRETLLFSDLFERLPLLQQQILLLLAKEKTRYKELEEELGENVGGILHQMVNAQLIERIEKGQYDIFDPVFKESIKYRINLF